jgi:hypothetical protein
MAYHSDGLVVPIALREDFVARVHIPDDLTAVEAEKIARVVKAYASPTQAQETER